MHSIFSSEAKRTDFSKQAMKLSIVKPFKFSGIKMKVMSVIMHKAHNNNTIALLYNYNTIVILYNNTIPLVFVIYKLQVTDHTQTVKLGKRLMVLWG